MREGGVIAEELERCNQMARGFGVGAGLLLTVERRLQLRAAGHALAWASGLFCAEAAEAPSARQHAFYPADIGLPEEAPPPPEDVAALKLNLGKARAEATDLRVELARTLAELGKLREDLVDALGMGLVSSDTVRADKDIVAAARSARALAAIATVASATPAEGEVNALKASLEDARRGEEMMKDQRDHLAKERLTIEQQASSLRASMEEAREAEQRERERAEKAERELGVQERGRNDALAALARCEMERDHFASRAGGPGRLPPHLANVQARQQLGAELGAGLAERYENARRQTEEAKREAAKANEDRALAIERLRQRDGVVEDLRSECQRLERELGLMAASRDRFRSRWMQAQADTRITEAQALRRRLVETQDAVRRLKATVVMMAVERVELLTAMGVVQKDSGPGRRHVCDVWQPAAGGGPGDTWVCETCGKPFEGAVFDPQPRAPPEELQCHGSGAPLGPLDGRGRYRCPECDFSVGVTPKALEALPAHRAVHAGEEAP